MQQYDDWQEIHIKLTVEEKDFIHRTEVEGDGDGSGSKRGD